MLCSVSFILVRVGGWLDYYDIITISAKSWSFSLDFLLSLAAVFIEAVNSYWKGQSRDGMDEWHFFKTSVFEKIKTYHENSEVLDKILLKKNNLPFINWYVYKLFINFSLFIHIQYILHIFQFWLTIANCSK